MRAMLTALPLLFPTATLADEAREQFVESNLLGIFYHELGHAVIDLEGVLIFGQEEDAADVFSIFMIDALFEDPDATALAYDASFGFLGEAAAREEQVGEVAWWDTHGPDEQRFYNTVCVFYGADPDSRQEFAEDLELPEERADYCPTEYDAANASWGQILDEMAGRKSGPKMRYAGVGDSLTAQVVENEVAQLNQMLRLSQPLTVKVEACGEANAFYDPDAQAVTMCSEFEDHLRQIFDLL
jgi:hypothetical protein